MIFTYCFFLPTCGIRNHAIRLAALQVMEKILLIIGLIDWVRLNIYETLKGLYKTAPVSQCQTLLFSLLIPYSYSTELTLVGCNMELTRKTKTFACNWVLIPLHLVKVSCTHNVGARDYEICKFHIFVTSCPTDLVQDVIRIEEICRSTDSFHYSVQRVYHATVEMFHVNPRSHTTSVRILHVKPRFDTIVCSLKETLPWRVRFS